MCMEKGVDANFSFFFFPFVVDNSGQGIGMKKEREKEKTPKKRKRKDEKKHHGIVGDGGVSCLWLRFSFSDDNDENDGKKVG